MPGVAVPEFEFEESTKKLNVVLGTSLLLKVQYVSTVLGRLMVQLEWVDRNIRERNFKLLLQATRDHSVVSSALTKSLMKLSTLFQQTSQGIKQHEQLSRYNQSETFESRPYREKITNLLDKASEPLLVCCLFTNFV